MEIHNLHTKQLIIFDLDGTLVESKSDMDEKMSGALINLLRRFIVAVIGGGTREQFFNQFVSKLAAPNELLQKLHLFPTCAAQYYSYEGNVWEKKYAHYLSPEEKARIVRAFDEAFREHNYTHPAEVYGEIIEDRGVQMTFSALGQRASVEKKREWNKELNDVRLAIVRTMQNTLPHEFEARFGGMTSIDVTRKGVDKAYGIRKIEKFLRVPKSAMLFIGDALYEGGNDYPVMREGVEVISVKNPSDTKQLIEALLA